MRTQLSTAGFVGEGTRPGAKKYQQPLEAGKRQGNGFSPSVTAGR